MPIIDRDVERYAEEHTTAELPELRAVAEETRRELSERAGMLTGHLEGSFLRALIAMTGARRVLEIGTFTGYSAMSMASALPADGQLVTCEVNPDHEAIARRHIDASPWRDQIEIRMGDALETIGRLEGPFDFVFIDADKVNYRNYYEAVLPKLSDNGAIAVDNVLWSGRVLDDSDSSADTRAIVEFNDAVAQDERVECVMVTVRDGVSLIRRRRA